MGKPLEVPPLAKRGRGIGDVWPSELKREILNWQAGVSVGSGVVGGATGERKPSLTMGVWML